MCIHTYHSIITYNAETRNASAVNRFVNGKGERSEKIQRKATIQRYIRRDLAMNLSQQALGAGDRQFESGHPEEYFFRPTAFTYIDLGLGNQRSLAVDVIVND